MGGTSTVCDAMRKYFSDYPWIERKRHSVRILISYKSMDFVQAVSYPLDLQPVWCMDTVGLELAWLYLQSKKYEDVAGNLIS
jgi:hypothetical protein